MGLPAFHKALDLPLQLYAPYCPGPSGVFKRS
jgi:hypothetical protein